MILKTCVLANLQNYCTQHGSHLLIKIEKVLKVLALILLGFYRSFLTAFFGGTCRFEPSCSEYARQAFYIYRIDKAFILTLKRLLKCRPGGPFGFDPVPPVQCCEVNHKEDNLK